VTRKSSKAKKTTKTKKRVIKRKNINPAVDQYRGLREAARQRRGSSVIDPTYRNLLEVPDAEIDVAKLKAHDIPSKGPPSKLEDKRIRGIIIDYISQANYPGVAAKAAGISPMTLKRWLKWGKEGKDKLYYDFWCDVRSAEAVAEINRVKQILKHEKTDWRAGMEILSRRFPERWSKKEIRQSHLQVDGKITATLRDQFSMKIVNDPRARNLARELITRTINSNLIENKVDEDDIIDEDAIDEDTTDE